MKIWAFVPARGGSKSIPKKNLADLGGRPMIDYGVNAVVRSALCERVVCSTEDDEIAGHLAGYGIEVDRRPTSLAQDDTPVAEVAVEFLRRSSPPLPDLLLLVQPTSPFLTAGQIKSLVDAMARNPQAQSGQTVAKPPHNYHAWNQRIVENGCVRFMFANERSSAYNKQKKPEVFIFGNLIAVRPEALCASRGFFAEPSAAVEIPWPYYLDVDGVLDLELARLLLKEGSVQLDTFALSKRG